MTFRAPDSTTTNTTEFKPDRNAIAFAPELVQFIHDNKKLTTYRFGKKYDHLQVGDIVTLQDSSTGKSVGKVRITAKKETTFKNLPLSTTTHEAYRDKDHQREVLSGYYAYIGGKIRDDDPFLIFDFELAAK
ncbi:MAG TPA: hypothetical protein VLG11_03730 [Candidatus Saccharimonadales bacterium]|nr:hypothetical protein [Candidatus Saccharimonadales bacterium]